MNIHRSSCRRKSERRKGLEIIDETGQLCRVKCHMFVDDLIPIEERRVKQRRVGGERRHV